MENVRYIDSVGLGILIQSCKKICDKHGYYAQNDQPIKLIMVNPQIRDIFERTALVVLFGFYESEKEAIDAIKGNS